MEETVRVVGSASCLGGRFLFVLECDEATVKTLGITAVTLYGIYKVSGLIERTIDGVLFRWLGGPGDDHAIADIGEGSLLVQLQCFTDEKFLEVWDDYESGGLKKRLLDEFAACEIEVEGLKIDIENLEEVNETRKKIEYRKRMEGSEIPTSPAPGMKNNERGISPGIIVTCGAFSAKIPLINVFKDEFMRGVKLAVKEGYAVLMKGGMTAIDAVEEAVRIMEDNGHFNAGRGSITNQNGIVECDTMIMNGKTMETGAVMALRNITNPVSLSRKVMEETPHCALCAEGALEFARKINDTAAGSRVGISDNWCFENNVKELYEGMGIPDLNNPISYDTVAAVAIDASGHLACATSTGGIPGKMKCRVGDAPLVGCGGYANEFGAATSTGQGEALMKMTLARDVVFNMENGLNAKESAEKSVRRMQDRIRGFGGIIAIDKDGNFGKAFNTDVMIWASVKDDELNYGMERGECKTEHM